MSVEETFTITLTVNGENVTRAVPVRQHLVDFLRTDLGLTGSHIGCEHGICGACSVRVNGQVLRGCLMLAVQADGAEVTTIEGLSSGGDLHPMQEAFWANHGLQCGYCTPGMIMSATDLLRRNPNPSEEDVRKGLEGNLCRCTGYHNIVKAVLDAAQNRGGTSIDEPAPPKPEAREEISKGVGA